MSNVLGTLGLSKDEEKIYKILLVSGQLSGGEIRSATRLSRETVDTALNVLETKKLIRKVPGLQDRFAALLPVDAAMNKVQESLGTITNLGREFREDKEKTVEAIRQAVDAVLNELDNELNGLKDDINAQANHIQSEIKSRTDETKLGFTQKNQTFGKELEQTKADLDRRIHDLVTNQITRVDLVFQSTNQKTTETLNKFVEETHLDAPSLAIDLSEAKTVSEAIKERLEVLKESEKAISSRQRTILSDQSTEIKRLSEQGKESLSQKVNAAFEEYQNVNASVTEAVETSFGKVSETLTKSRELISQSSAGFSQTNSQASTTLSSTKNTLEVDLKEGIAAIETSLSNSFQMARRQVEMGKNEGENFVHQVGMDIETTLSGMETDFDALIKEKEAEIKQKLESEFQRLFQETSKTIEDLNSNLTATLRQKIDSSRVQTKEVQSNALDAFNRQTSENLQQLSGMEEQQLGRLGSLKQELTSKLNDAFASLNDQLTQLQQKIMVDMNSSMESIDQEAVTIKENQTSLKGQLDQFLANLKTSLDTLRQTMVSEQQEFTTSVDAQASQIEGQLDALMSDIDQDINTSVQEIETLFQNLSEQLTQQVQNSNAHLSKQVDDLHQNLKTYLDNLKGDLEKIASTGGSEQKSLIEAFKLDLTAFSERAQALTSSLSQQISEEGTLLAGTLLTMMSQQNKKMKENAVLSAEKAKQAAGSISRSATEKSDELLGRYVGNFISNSESLVDSLQNLSESLAGFSKLIDTTQTPEIKTTTIVGKEAIVEFIADMLGRIKSKATILVPSISMVNEERVLQLPRTAQVTIVSYIDEVTDRDWIEKMHNAPANVTLRAIQKGGLGGTLPDFIGCEREGEEILLGTIDEGNDDYVAIASGSEYFVKILGNIVISDYARGRSRQLPK